MFLGYLPKDLKIMATRTSIASYKKHSYSGPKKSRKKVRAQLKRAYGVTSSRAEVWRKKIKKEELQDELDEGADVEIPNAAPMKACRGCLDTEGLLFDLSDTDLVNIFSECTGQSVSPSDGYPQHICKLCLYQLQKFVKFRHRCIKSIYLLQQLEAKAGAISTDAIKVLDRGKLKHNFVYTETLILELSASTDDDIIKQETPLPESLDNRNEESVIIINNEGTLDGPQDISNDCTDFDDVCVQPVDEKTDDKTVSKETTLSETNANKSGCSMINNDKINKISKENSQNEFYYGIQFDDNKNTVKQDKVKSMVVLAPKRLVVYRNKRRKMDSHTK